MKLNTALQAKRKQKGLTQAEIALKCNITERNYQRIEKGEQDPKTQTALLIAKALNTTVEKLFTAEMKTMRQHGE